MAFTPKTWQCGETITADELNRMEQGIAENSGGGTAYEPLIVTLTTRDATAEECSDGGSVAVLSHSPQEITDAIASGRPTYVQDPASPSVKFLFPVIEARLPLGAPFGFFTILITRDDSVVASKVYFDDASSKEIINCDSGK